MSGPLRLIHLQAKFTFAPFSIAISPLLSIGPLGPLGQQLLNEASILIYSHFAIASPTFPDLKLTAEQIFQAEQPT
jgi:hypothetical protein